MPPVVYSAVMTPKELITHFKTQARAAEKIGRSQPTIARWFKDGIIPQAMQCEIQLRTRGRLKADPLPKPEVAR